MGEVAHGGAKEQRSRGAEGNDVWLGSGCDAGPGYQRRRDSQSAPSGVHAAMRNRWGRSADEASRVIATAVRQIDPSHPSPECDNTAVCTPARPPPAPGGHCWLVQQCECEPTLNADDTLPSSGLRPPSPRTLARERSDASRGEKGAIDALILFSFALRLLPRLRCLAGPLLPV